MKEQCSESGGSRLWFGVASALERNNSMESGTSDTRCVQCGQACAIVLSDWAGQPVRAFQCFDESRVSLMCLSVYESETLSALMICLL